MYSNVNPKDGTFHVGDTASINAIFETINQVEDMIDAESQRQDERPTASGKERLRLLREISHLLYTVREHVIATAAE